MVLLTGCVCIFSHQGVNGVTNAYLNSIWLLNRLGIMANANVSVMARQSLVGYNYSLLGPCFYAKPDGFCTKADRSCTKDDGFCR